MRAQFNVESSALFLGINKVPLKYGYRRSSCVFVKPLKQSTSIKIIRITSL